MLKKTFAVAAIALGLVVASASAASADYTGTPPISAGDPVMAPGGSTVITVTGLPEGAECVAFQVLQPEGGDGSVDPTTVGVSGDTASTTFTASVLGAYTIEVLTSTAGCGAPPASIVSSAVFAAAEFVYFGSVTITVAVPTDGGSGPAAPGAAPGLPPTGGQVPAAALWLGIGAVGIGAIAVTAGVARRRAAANR